jgi:hypothetical protein
MTSTFIRHEFKAFWRARNTGKSIAVHIFMGFLILYFLTVALYLGFNIDTFLKKAFPKDDLLVSFCGVILLYYAAELLSRMQLQELPTLRVQPYLQLAIKRNTLVKYLAFTSMLSFFNLWPLILFIPFIVKVIAVQKGGLIAFVFILSLVGFSIFNNYLALYIKRKASLNGWIMLASTLGLALIGMGDFKWHLYSIRDFSYGFFGHLITNPALILVPILLAVAMYYVNFLFLKENLYLEELTKHKTLKRATTEFPLLDRFGHIGDLVANEIKLVIRNKRPSSALKVSLVFLFYGVIFYRNPQLHEPFKVFVGMFMTGIFIISYGQYMYGWQATHFDGILVSKISFSDFLKAKYLLFTLVSTVAFILTIPYVYYGWRTVLVHFVMYLWNLGVNSTIILFFANRNSKRIDLSKGAAFNWEGVGVTQLLLTFPLLILPYIIYVPVKLLGGGDNWPLAALALIALTGIFTRSYWIKTLTADFYKRKFKIAEGFRNK